MLTTKEQKTVKDIVDKIEKNLKTTYPIYVDAKSKEAYFENVIYVSFRDIKFNLTIIKVCDELGFRDVYLYADQYDEADFDIYSLQSITKEFIICLTKYGILTKSFIFEYIKEEIECKAGILSVS